MMCVVSNMGDDFTHTFPQKYPNTPWTPATPTEYPIHIGVSQEEFDEWKEKSAEQFEALKAEIEALKDLLKAAKIYDEKTGQKDCEMGEKVALIEELAERLGVDLGDVFGEKKSV